MKNKVVNFMKIRKAVLLYALITFSFFALIGCISRDNKPDSLDNKESINNEANSNANSDNNQNEDNTNDNSENKEQDIDSNGNSENDEQEINSNNNSDNKQSEEEVLPREYNECLQKENEEIIISFTIADSDKVVSLCTSKEEPSYLVYRFGTPENIELEYPENQVDSWDSFTYSYYLRGGASDNEALDLNYVTFEYNGLRYQIFQEYSSNSESTKVGIRMTDLTTNEETILEASEDSIIGNLIELRDNDKIKIEQL